MESARDCGIALENIIAGGICALPEVIHKSEQEIRSHFGDQSMNGVDHWITYRGEHIFAQTKWRDTITQPEISQFLSCADRIQSRLPEAEQGSVILLWISKHEPTKFAKTLLAERKVDIVCCSISCEALARNVILWVAETFGIDPIPGLLTVPIRKCVRECKAATAIAPSGVPVPIPRLEYDETEGGHTARRHMIEIITGIHNDIYRRLQNALSSVFGIDVRSIVEMHFPCTVDAWSNGTFTKINFNALLRTIKPICCPTKTKKFLSHNFFFYCKMRYISTELAKHVNTYTAQRTQMCTEKSAWGRRLPVLICNPEPMTDAEYRNLIVNCSDYMINIIMDGKVEKRPSSHMDNMFFSNYYIS